MSKMNKMQKEMQKLQKKMHDLQKELEDSLLQIEASGGAISLEISADQVLHRLKIQPDMVDPHDVEGLEDALLTAVNQAIQESKKYADEKHQEISGGLLPGGMPF